MKQAVVKMPRLNANEDEAIVAALHIGAGDSFDAGALLFTIETTKAANDIIAPAAGRIENIAVAKGDMVSVGALIAEILLAAETELSEGGFEWADGEAKEIADAAGPDGVKISAKARMLARKLGVDIGSITPVNGAVRVEDVEAAAKTAETATDTNLVAKKQAAPAILQKYAANTAILYGGAGHARAIMDTARNSGYDIIGALDDGLPAGTSVMAGCEILGTGDLLPTLYDRGVRVALVGVGGPVSSAVRAKIFNLLVAAGFTLPPLISENAHLGMGAQLGLATYLFSGANVGPAVEIGNDCIINQNVVVAHDSIIGDHVHLAPNAVIAGHCRIGDHTTVGMCATVINGASIGKDCLIHNGVAITQDIADGRVVTQAGIRGG